MLSWQIFVTDIILFDGILAGEKYITPVGTFQQHYWTFLQRQKYIYGICQSGEENWKMESFFNIAIYLIYKGKTCPHHNGDSDRDSVCFKF